MTTDSARAYIHMKHHTSSHFAQLNPFLMTPHFEVAFVFNGWPPVETVSCLPISNLFTLDRHTFLANSHVSTPCTFFKSDFVI